MVEKGKKMVVENFGVSDAELFTMFNIELGGVDWGEYVSVPLWRVKRRKPSKRAKKHVGDNIKPGVTIHEPGTKGRVEDLVKFYAENSANEVSAFEV